MSGVIYTVRPDGLLREAESIERSAKENQRAWIILGQLDRYSDALKEANLLRRAAAEKSVYTRREILRNAGYTVKSPKTLRAGFKTNPRPKKYSNAAERQAAYRERNVLIEIRLDAKTADTLTRLAQDFDLPRAELATQVLKHGLLNRNWATMGPRYDLGSDTSQTGMRVVPRLRSQAGDDQSDGD